MCGSKNTFSKNYFQCIKFNRLILKSVAKVWYGVDRVTPDIKKKKNKENLLAIWFKTFKYADIYISAINWSKSVGVKVILSHIIFIQFLIISSICLFSGHGAFGEVFLARAVGIKDGEEATTVMVKALQTRDEHQQLEFRREIDMLTKLNHANIVKLLGLCREVEPQLMITEYLDWVSWDEGVSQNQIYELNNLLSLIGLHQEYIKIKTKYANLM